jgi:murein DD-endopeptidase MepM/ murein hydrolase activator NlpD
MSTNDYYALDFIRREKGNGHDKPVVAAAGGTVRYAGWTHRGWAPYGKIVYIEHDYVDRRGRRYQSLYGHLQRVVVRVGQRVQAGDVIGTLGGSSRHRLRRFGSHLHFAVYQAAGPRIGGGRAVVPEPLGKFEDLRRGRVLTACGSPSPTPVAAAEPGTAAMGGLVSREIPPRALRPATESVVRLAPTSPYRLSRRYFATSRER